MILDVTPPVVLDAKEDQMTTSVIVNFDEGVPVPTEEVIRYLESPALRSRTRKKVNYSIEKTCDKGTSICVRFRCTLDWFFRVDILNALKEFFTRRGFAPCVA